LLSISLCLDIGIVNAALINTGLRKGCARRC
jgi:L-lysine exporter family protein LysE/ArgO